MINKTLGITPRTAASPAQLRADRIQTGTLIQLGRAIAAGDDRARRLIDALEDLGRLADGLPRDGEVDEALDDVAHLASLDSAVMDLTQADVEQLADEAMHAHAIGGGSVVPLPQQQNRRAS